MRRICIAMEKLDHVLGPAHEGVVDRLARNHPTHGNRAGSDPFRKGDHVGENAITFGCKRMPQPAKPGDDLVKDEQNAIFIADRAQTPQVAFRSG
jgi:hypothetical protein